MTGLPCALRPQTLLFAGRVSQTTLDRPFRACTAPPNSRRNAPSWQLRFLRLVLPFSCYLGARLRSIVSRHCPCRKMTGASAAHRAACWANPKVRPPSANGNGLTPLTEWNTSIRQQLCALSPTVATTHGDVCLSAKARKSNLG